MSIGSYCLDRQKQAKAPGQRAGRSLLVVALGMAEADIEAAVETLYPTASSLTILATNESPATAKADELWVYAPLGLRGFLALIRRISWRHFDAVHQPHGAPHWLKYLVWPRPHWHS